jgi:flagellar basal-body rod protein FlgG
MMRALWTSASGMIAQQNHIDTISNNLANVNTTGYKKSRADFTDTLYQTMRAAGTSESSATTFPTSVSVGLGSQMVSTTMLFSQGTFQQTDNPLDVAIEGSGFFVVTLPNGTQAYTRDGSFKVDGEGRIVTSQGYPLEPEIVIPSDMETLGIGTDGTVSVVRSGQTTSEQLGQMQLAIFQNPGGLSRVGGNLYTPTAASGEATVGNPGEEGRGSLQQGVLENSNVQIVEEMVNLIIAQRAFETNSRAIQTADEMLGIANALRR